MKSKHLQTLYQTFFRKVQSPDFEIEKFVLEDGDFLENYWSKTNKPQTNTPLVIIFHGLAGSYKSPYIQGLINALNDVGYNAVVMHFRGCSGTPNLLPRSYHSGETSDALAFINSLKTRLPQSKLYAIGFSLGGNMLLKLLGELQQSSPLSGAVAVSPPMQLDICADAIHKSVSKVYERRLVNELNKTLIKKYELHDMESLLGVSIAQVKKIKTFWEFDSIYTAPIHGFKSAQDYYTQSSSKQFLKDIHTPTLIIHAKDDPFMNQEVIPKKEELSKYVHLELSEHGGHVGFIEGNLFSPKYWLEKNVICFLNKIS